MQDLFEYLLTSFQNPKSLTSPVFEREGSQQWSYALLRLTRLCEYTSALFLDFDLSLVGPVLFGEEGDCPVEDLALEELPLEQFEPN